MYEGQKFKNKICVRCGKDYTPNSSVQKVCLDCRILAKKEWKKQYNKINKDKVNAYNKLWYKNNLERARNTKRRWNWTENGIQYRKDWELKNREYVNERAKKYRTENNGRRAANHIVTKLGLKRICEYCNTETRVHIHHKDGNPNNNIVSNLQMLCLFHHAEMHHQVRLRSS